MMTTCEEKDMQATRGSSVEGLSVGLMIIAFAVSLLLAWVMGDWWLFIPLILIIAGVIWAGLGLVARQAEATARGRRSDTTYYFFWGATMALFGAIWLVNDQYPGNAPGLVVLVLVWIGAVVVVLSVKKKKA